jgi:hypothetical protein
MEEEIKKIELELEEIKDKKERLRIQYILALRAEIELNEKLTKLKITNSKFK